MKPDTTNVVTYYTVGNSAATAKRQLDYAFASRGFHEGREGSCLERRRRVGRKRSLPPADRGRERMICM